MGSCKSNRDQDRVPWRDMIDLGLVDRASHDRLPPPPAARLDPLPAEAGR